MRKTIKLKNLDCANCAAKIENKVSKIEGVEDISVNFLSQKMIISAPDDIFASCLEKAKIISKKIEKDIEFID